MCCEIDFGLDLDFGIGCELGYVMVIALGLDFGYVMKLVLD